MAVTCCYVHSVRIEGLRPGLSGSQPSSQQHGTMCRSPSVETLVDGALRNLAQNDKVDTITHW